MTDAAAAGPEAIESWHAHVYFDAETAATARALYDRVKAAFPAAEMGRFHERPVGPHPMGSYQIAFTPDLLAPVLSWLALNRGGLDVFVHPNTGDGLADHRDHVVFLGKSYPLNLSIFDS
ncbi:DOPA 4,5-dioxygenase family protein [Thalassobaculum sp. OXR-137]|uniref:DOPA 4,5-dioxygenase family protein n=1 Tax=Thalassobaculum sp. OXR-137 TaxID=3100173 RepID=UPI002AC9365D|nr:DOPA 4,5-dioxygenase family protein [Thalassobaculum sp. OXR-137]WPZ37006.1 DOPA 4,5-dioxygenase family protein [Thalassobaculum sp. OXR-137]